MQACVLEMKWKSALAANRFKLKIPTAIRLSCSNLLAIEVASLLEGVNPEFTLIQKGEPVRMISPRQIHQGAHESIGKPVFVLVGRPSTLAYQHSVEVPPSQRPENVARRRVIESRPQLARTTQKSDGAFLPLVTLLFLTLKAGKFGRDDASTAQQIENCTLRLVYAARDGSSQP